MKAFRDWLRHIIFAMKHMHQAARHLPGCRFSHTDGYLADTEYRAVYALCLKLYSLIFPTIYFHFDIITLCYFPPFPVICIILCVCK